MAPKSKKKTKDKNKSLDGFVTCRILELPDEMRLAAADSAITINPANAPREQFISSLLSANIPEPDALAFLTGKLWSSTGIDLGVAFMDNPSSDLRSRTLEYANLWSRSANIRFRESSLSMADIRVAFRSGQGHYSYLGTDCRLVPRDQPTMNLELTMRSSLSEWDRVDPHEFGHAIGCPHEHLRAAIIRRLNVQKTIAWARRTYGWNEQMVRSNILTPVEERSVLGTLQADEESVMAYSLPGEITTDGQPIVGGHGINETDHAWAARVYPKPDQPPPPKTLELTISQDLQAGRYRLTAV